jgi:hypothetical protein
MVDHCSDVQTLRNALVAAVQPPPTVPPVLRMQELGAQNSAPTTAINDPMVAAPSWVSYIR